jgi:hypothetical protein
MVLWGRRLSKLILKRAKGKWRHVLSDNFFPVLDFIAVCSSSVVGVPIESELLSSLAIVEVI